MHIVHILQQKQYVVLAILFSGFMLFLYPFVQTIPQGLNNFWFWFSLLTPVTWILYVTYSLLFGVTCASFIWRWKEKRCNTVCALMPSTTGKAWGAIGTFVGVILPQCASCVSIATIFFPLSFAIFLVKYNVWVMLLSDGLLVLALYFLGAFKQHVSI